MEHGHSGSSMSWGRFAAMIATSVVIMFALMYQLVYSPDHVLFSSNRLIASLAMGCVMTVVMLGFMWSSYQGKTLKLAVVASASALALLLLGVNRSQAVVEDTRFLQAMIPHHSIAVNNARKASLSDPRVRELADRIIESQVREIAEMELLLDDIDRRGERGSEELPARTAELTPEMEREARRILQ